MMANQLPSDQHGSPTISIQNVEKFIVMIQPPVHDQIDVLIPVDGLPDSEDKSEMPDMPDAQVNDYYNPFDSLPDDDENVSNAATVTVKTSDFINLLIQADQGKLRQMGMMQDHMDSQVQPNTHYDQPIDLNDYRFVDLNNGAILSLSDLEKALDEQSNTASVDNNANNSDNSEVNNDAAAPVVAVIPPSLFHNSPPPRQAEKSFAGFFF